MGKYDERKYDKDATERLTEDELDWLRNCGAEEAYKMSMDVEDARQESQRKIEPDGPVR